MRRSWSARGNHKRFSAPGQRTARPRATQREKLLTPVFRDETGVVLVPAFGEAERCACRDGGAALLIMIEEKNIDM